MENAKTMRNALVELGYNAGTADPCVTFWTDQALWPPDAGGYIFAARALLMIGQHLLKDDWSDDAPTTEYIRELPDQLSLFTPVSEIERGIKLLRQTESAYGTRVGVGSGLFRNWSESEFPTTAEWAEAVQLAKEQQAVAWRKVLPFLKAQIALEQACLRQTVKSGTRGRLGGQITAQEWHFWNYENAWMRFGLCRVDPASPHQLPLATESGDWIFIELASLQAYLSGPLPVVEASQANAAAARAKSRERGGRRTQYDWRHLAEKFGEFAEQGQFGSKDSASRIADSLLDAVAEAWDKLPDKRMVEERVAEWQIVRRRVAI